MVKGGALLLLILPAAFASLQVLDPIGPFGNTSVYCTTASMLLGPQYEAATFQQGPLFAFYGDACDLSSIPDAVEARIVFLLTKKFKCRHNVIFNNFARRNAAAVLQVYQNGLGSIPGNTYYGRFDDEVDKRTSSSAMLFLLVQDTKGQGGVRIMDVLSMSATSRIIVRVSPDANVWVPAFASIPYQTFVRWLPSLFLLGVSCNAMTFLVIHTLMNVQRVQRSGKKMRWSSWLHNVFSITQLTLFIDMVCCAVIGGVMGAYGWWSVLGPAPFQVFMNTGLSGWALACDILSAKTWSARCSEIPGASKKGSVSRIARAFDHPIIGTICILVPIIIDTWLCTLYYLSRVFANVEMLVVGACVIFQVIIGVHFLRQSTHYVKIVRTHMGMQDDANKKLKEYLDRMSRWQTILGYSMLIYVSVLFVGATTFIFTPTGWTMFFACESNMRALSSLCRVRMNKPKLQLFGMIAEEVKSRLHSVPSGTASPARPGKTIVNVSTRRTVDGVTSVMVDT